MERQRSIAIKPTRFLVFTFTISSFLVFVSFISLWIVKNSPARRESFFLFFNKTPIAVSFFRPVNLQTVNGFGRNFSGSDAITNLLDAHSKKPENASGFAGISVSGEENAAEDGGGDGNTTAVRPRGGGLPMKEVEVANSERIADKFEPTNNFSRSDSITNFLDTHLKKPENVSGFAGIPVSGVEDGGGDGNSTAVQPRRSEIPIKEAEVVISERIEKKFEASNTILGTESHRCDLAKGKWVFDETNPLYSNSSCPFIDEGFDCEGNGRFDLNYKKLKWQPQDCGSYRFNATKMLELIRGKRVVFVGDSINRNQWESMLCMLFSAIKDPRKVYETHGRRITKKKGNYSFKFVDYKCTVEFYVSHFLVHEDKARLGRRRVQTLRIDTIDRGSSRWRGADVLVFNSAHWWSHYKTKSGVNYYQERDQVLPRLDVNIAFRRALTTWASWVDKYINSKKTRVFFRSSAPSHFRGGQWNSGGHCREATEPLNQTSTLVYPEKNLLVEDVINQMKTPVTLLNITGLSDYRIDGHPSIYGKSFVNRQSSKGGEDCSHWCLPGVPDAWNELLYFHLKYREMVR